MQPLPVAAAAAVAACAMEVASAGAVGVKQLIAAASRYSSGLLQCVP
jgi:hypothetical protein